MVGFAAEKSDNLLFMHVLAQERYYQENAGPYSRWWMEFEPLFADK